MLFNRFNFCLIFFLWIEENKLFYVGEISACSDPFVSTALPVLVQDSAALHNFVLDYFFLWCVRCEEGSHL